MSEWAVCSACGRVIYITHRNTDGQCMTCSPPVNGQPILENEVEFVQADDIPAEPVNVVAPTDTDDLSN